MNTIPEKTIFAKYPILKEICKNHKNVNIQFVNLSYKESICLPNKHIMLGIIGLNENELMTALLHELGHTQGCFDKIREDEEFAWEYAWDYCEKRNLPFQKHIMRIGLSSVYKAYNCLMIAAKSKYGNSVSDEILDTLITEVIVAENKLNHQKLT